MTARLTTTRLTTILAVLLFWWLALDSMVGDSPTMDEQNHLARGVALWQTADPRLSLEHPPLVNLLSTLPVVTLLPELRLPTDDASWETPGGWYAFAEKLVWEYNRDVNIGRLFFVARLPILFLTLGLGLVAYRLAWLLWGKRAALLALLFVLFDPNVLANGRYTTTDLGGTAFLFLAVLLLWRVLSVPRWDGRRWLWLVLGLGLAFGSKLSTLVFVPIWGVLGLLPLYGRFPDWRGAGRRLLQLGTAGLLSVLVVWALFAFEWGPFKFGGEGLKSLNRLSGPMPTFWAGIEQILSFSGGGRPSFLNGQFSLTGFPDYFWVALRAKTPPAILLMVPLATVVLLWRKEARGKVVFLLGSAVFYFLISLQSGLNIGYRHLLPMLPFLHVLMSGVAEVGRGERGIYDLRFTIYDLRITYYVLRITPYVALVGLLVSTLSIRPFYLSYFNSWVGGPENGRNILIDSNIDWGQDLLRLQAWMAAHGVEQVKLGWFGTADPSYYGIGYEPMPGLGREEFFRLWYPPPFNPEQPEPGVYAISVSNLWESHWETKITYPWFRSQPPSDRVGYSILIYVVPGS
ncbi:MAG: glycosyltransferase family 39 protein [Ardenticatenaceae bacterium]|nr:glycosyltransferase family 39 protein [Ardenticatenaceae bacterium]